MEVLRIAAFADGEFGGNPAGVVIAKTLPGAREMQEIAAEVGYSETVFACPKGNGWRVRYFSPVAEVPFCGHATIALGSAMTALNGEGVFPLKLNEADISVEGKLAGNCPIVTLQSPGTKSRPAGQNLVRDVLALFNYRAEELDDRIPPARIEAGATHIVLALSDRKRLSDMSYDLQAGRRLMEQAGLVTISLIYIENNQLFHSRNAFASGGVLEDPATGAAAAALGGYLRDIGWPHGGKITIVQGEDMGARSLIRAEIGAEIGSSIRVSGTTREIG